MMTRVRVQIAIVALLIALTGCSDDESTPAADPTCTTGEQACEGEQIKICLDDGTWGAAEDCAAGKTCSTGHEGMGYIHCMEIDMAMDAMDHDSMGMGMDHDSMGMGQDGMGMDHDSMGMGQDGMGMDDTGPMP